MAGSGGTGGKRAMLTAMVLAGLAISPQAIAAAEDQTVVLPGTTVVALAADLDGDGDREIVRLLQDENPRDHAVDAWEQDGARWSSLGSARLAPVATVEEGFDAGAEAATLIVSQVAGRDRVLALSAALLPSDPDGATCCLTISELRLTDGGDLELLALQQVGGGAQSAWTADVDGDGSDDLVLQEGRYGATEEEQTATVRVLRWSGSAFETVFEQTDRQLLYGFTVADSDGVAGKDLLFGPGTDGRIRRLAWAGDGMQLDQAHIDAGEPPEGWIVGVADGAIVLGLGQETRVVRWPRGMAATTVERMGTIGFPGITLVGDGPEALLVVQGNGAFASGRPPAVAVHDLGLRLLGEVGVSPGTERLWEVVNGGLSSPRGIMHNIYPYNGPLPTGLLDDRAAYVSSGVLIQSGSPDGYEARPMASLVGVQPIGAVGFEDAWVLLGTGYSPPPGSAYLNWGVVPPEWGRVVVMPLDRFLQPADQVSGVSFELTGAVEVAREGGVARLMAERDGFQITISAPAGSVVINVNGLLTDEHEVADQPLVVEVGAPRNRRENENQEFEATLLVVTPDGRGLTRDWVGTFVREPPALSVSASTNSMALGATLDGRTGQGSVVTANGKDLGADPEGRFEASIDAPIWPSRVVVTARDPLGNETTQLIEVVGLVDYRGLPWAAILIAVTVIVGGVLFVRTPQRRAEAAEGGGDGRLEELELDAIDGFEPPGR